VRGRTIRFSRAGGFSIFGTGRIIDGTMLEALEDYVKRQKKRLGIDPEKKEAAN